MELRVRNLEQRVNLMEEKIETMIEPLIRNNDKGKDIRIDESKEEHNYNYLNLEPTQLEPGIELIPIICNRENLSYIQITKIIIKDQEIVIPTFLDTGATTNTIDASLIPIEIVFTSKKPKKLSQFDTSELKFNKYIKNIKMHQQTRCMKWSDPYL